MVLRFVSGRAGRPEIHSGTARDTRYPVPSAAEYFATRLTKWRFEDAKYVAAYILGELGEPSCASSVRQALINTLKIEQGRPPEPADQLGRTSGLAQYAICSITEGGRESPVIHGGDESPACPLTNICSSEYAA